MATTTSKVWDRMDKGDNHAMGQRAFIGLVTFWTLAGLAFSGALAYLTPVSLAQNTLALVGLSLLPFLGIFLTIGSKNPAVSLLGYALVAGPFGALLGPVTAQYEHASVLRVLAMTGGITLVLGIIGVAYPKSLAHWGGLLLTALISLIIGMLFVPIIALMGLPIRGALTVIDVVAVVIFSGFIVYDLNRAMRLERTHDNAIDAAASLYLDVVNLFLHLLPLGGEEK